MAGIFGKVAGFLGWEEKFSLRRIVPQLMLLWIVVPVIVLLVRILLPKLSEMMTSELMPALVGDILGIIVKLLTIISDGLKNAFAGMAQFSLSRAELLELASPFGPQATVTISNMDMVYLGVVGAIIGVLSGTPQAMYITMFVMLGENVLRILHLTDRMKLIVNVAAVFIGCIVWDVYGGTFGNTTLMLVGLAFLGLLNFVLQLIFLGMSWVKAGLAILIGLLCTAVSCCYLSALEWIFQFGTLSLMQCCSVILISGLMLGGLSFLMQKRSGLF